MEDLPGNLQSDLRSRRPARPSRRTARWTLLFVGDHGRTVSVKRFKGLFYLLVALLLIAAGAAAGLYMVNRRIAAENHRLTSEVTRLRSTVESLRYDKDVLTARLVLTEAELQKETGQVPAEEDAERTPEPAAGDEAAVPEQTSAPEPVQAPAQDPPKAEVDPGGGGPQADAAPGRPSQAVATPVGVENLSVVHQQELSLLQVTFVIRKDDPEPESVSGHAFVVLKPGGDPPQTDWVPMPPASIQDGRPNPSRRGQYFSIARFKPMKFEKRGVFDPERFEQLTVFVFDTRGELLLEEDFTVAERTVDAG